jgi:hypothetical protein
MKVHEQHTREAVGSGGKTRVRTRVGGGGLAAVGSDGRLLARVTSSHGRQRGQEAERDSSIGDGGWRRGRGRSGSGARRYIAKPAITSGSGPTSHPFCGV